MSLIVQLIVGELQLVETDHLSHPGVSRSQGVWVYINPWRHRGVSIASYHPLGAMVHVSETQKERGGFRDRRMEERRTKKQIRRERERWRDDESGKLMGPPWRL